MKSNIRIVVADFDEHLQKLLILMNLVDEVHSSFGKVVQLIDGNFAKPQLKNAWETQFVSAEELYFKRAVIDEEACTACGDCVQHCPEEAIIFDKLVSEIEIATFLCNGCSDCVSHCPENAIQISNMQYVTKNHYRCGDKAEIFEIICEDENLSSDRFVEVLSKQIDNTRPVFIDAAMSDIAFENWFENADWLVLYADSIDTLIHIEDMGIAETLPMCAVVNKDHPDMERMLDFGERLGIKFFFEIEMGEVGNEIKKAQLTDGSLVPKEVFKELAGKLG
ncbi:MAG: 4Fe-4S dicluster domain-containing protein [Bacteroidota bacterium]